MGRTAYVLTIEAWLNGIGLTNHPVQIAHFQIREWEAPFPMRHDAAEPATERWGALQ